MNLRWARPPEHLRHALFLKNLGKTVALCLILNEAKSGLPNVVTYTTDKETDESWDIFVI